jgi:hypothetical protein
MLSPFSREETDLRGVLARTDASENDTARGAGLCRRRHSEVGDKGKTAVFLVEITEAKKES